MAKQYPTVRRHVGSYDLCRANEKQAQYVFVLPDGAPKLRVNYVVPLDGEHDIGPGDWLEAASACVEHAARCLYCSQLDELKAMLAWLEENEPQLRLAEAAENVRAAKAVLSEAQEALTVREAEGK